MMKWQRTDRSARPSGPFKRALVLVVWRTLALAATVVNGISVGPGPGPGTLTVLLASAGESVPVAQMPLSQRFQSTLNQHPFPIFPRQAILGTGNKINGTSAPNRPSATSLSLPPWIAVPQHKPEPAVNADTDKKSRITRQSVHSKQETSLIRDSIFTPVEIGLASNKKVNNGDPVTVQRQPRRQCPSCQPPPDSVSESERQLADNARLESIKRQILIKLGLSAKPNVSTVPSRDFILETLLRADESLGTYSNPLPDGHVDVYSDSGVDLNAADGSVEDDFFGKTSEIIAFAEQGPRLNDQVLVEFSRIQETEPSLRVKSATLWLYIQLKGAAKNPRWPNHEKKPTLYIFRIASHGQSSNATVVTFDKGWNELIATQRLTVQNTGWNKINVTEGVQKWFSASDHGGNGANEKLRLLIDCSGCGTWIEPILFPSPNWQSSSKVNRRRRRVRLGAKKGRRSRSTPAEVSRHRPFLVVYTDSTSSRRLRRRALDCSPTTRACCKQRFFVSFRALGWDDWIIAPSGYYANYCRGDCGGPHRTPDTFLNYHSHVLEEFRRTDSYPDLQPCCAPTKFSSMSLIYFGPDMNIIKRDLPKMVVDECGCP